MAAASSFGLQQLKKKLLNFHQPVGQNMEQSHEVQGKGFQTQRRMTEESLLSSCCVKSQLSSMNQRSATAMDRPHPHTRAVKKCSQMVGDSTISLRLTISRSGA